MSLLMSVLRNALRMKKETVPLSKDDPLALHYEQELNRHKQIVNEAFPGPGYYEWLQWFHLFVQPKLYLEIGVESGKALANARPPTLAIGVDPALRINHEFSARTKLFQQTSDSFFAEPHLKEIFEDQKLDMAFIDGLHTFDQALQDFINVEKHAHRDTVVLFHDVLPVIPETADRERHTMFWIGDTWKVMLILKKYRPDLKLFNIPTASSGLGVAVHLDPNSTILAERYEEIVAEAMQFDLNDHLASLRTIVTTVDNQFDKVAQLLND
ncbi:class I SAM-dependent methyltransferase [Undibacterium cyanobacteriorum]|uniref:Class I SAM-dependent methyltransferase n=1 Tax=Undibacterium cyanobacteriorum TaxID=3073561 RepID=A0ABY9RHB5_9BURK|nr:class I SAM-dependent methyltransferase [Undibacterium sp. 20NA77.5]WMW80616.1 class I SAM-dependent methyltransferase [Undibacterium sp. 20NA77.5]